MTTDFETRFLAARRAVIARRFSHLNDMQQKAVMTTEGPLLLLAGAGSGKTTVLIQRIANLIAFGEGADSNEIPDYITEDDVEFLEQYAARKNATKAQISLSWMLHKYPNVVPIPGSKNQERILENLGAWNVALTDSEFAALEAALATIPVHGHRGFVEQQGSSMANWNRK